MNTKTISILLSFILLISLSFTQTSNAQESCENVELIYQDALNYFNTNKGEQKSKQTLLGTSFYNDYKINLWDAQKVKLTEVSTLSCNQLEYVYFESENLAAAEQVYKYLVQQFESCKPKGYIKVDEDKGSYLAKSHYIDERDKDSFLFYDWPEFEIVVSNFAGSYVTKIRIMSKKFD